MSLEFTTIAIILLAASIVLTLLNLAVGGLLALFTSISFKKAFLYGLWSLFLPPLLIAYGYFIERNLIVTEEVTVSHPQLPKAFEGYRIVHISDIHSRSFQNRQNVLIKAVEKINSLNPDLILFTGDLITMSPDELDQTAPVLSRLKAKDGVISILGNHDYCTHFRGRMTPTPNHIQLQRLIDRERLMGWHVLCNGHQFIARDTDTIAIVGVENITPSRHFPSTGNLTKASEGTEGLFRILLSHDPQHWDADTQAHSYPLTLSGHTHNCQFSIFGLTPAIFTYKHYNGLYKEGTSSNPNYLNVNPGLGETLLPARIGVPPQITIITLQH